jgi:broad specificity phosphatase PhoE
MDAQLESFIADQRLREKEFGILDRLTKFGITQRYPELAQQRSHVGKFYFRPPGGESWCDVILRLRSMLDTIVRARAQWTAGNDRQSSSDRELHALFVRANGRDTDPRHRSRRRHTKLRGDLLCV